MSTQKMSNKKKKKTNLDSPRAYSNLQKSKTDCTKKCVKLARQQLEDRVDKYKKNLHQFNHCKNFFQENKVNLFKTQAGIKEMINTTKKVTVTLTAYKMTVEL